MGFNPRPPRRAGATRLHGGRSGFWRVSILARPEGRALPASIDTSSLSGMFQSSPAPKGGRYRQRGRAVRWNLVVSILARPEGRALPSY